MRFPNAIKNQFEFLLTRRGVDVKELPLGGGETRLELCLPKVSLSGYGNKI